MSYLRVIKSYQLTDDLLLASDIPEDSAPEYDLGTTYAARDRVRVTAEHAVYESVQDNNVGQLPAVSQPLWWVKVGATNRHKAFDLSSSTKTLIESNGYYEIAAGKQVNAVALINAAGVSGVRVRMTDPDFGVVHDQSYSMASRLLRPSWYSWFFARRRAVSALIVRNLPSYPNAVLRLDIQSASRAAVGAILFGTEITLGGRIKKGAKLGFTDYSRKSRDEWGDVILRELPFSKRLTLPLLIGSDKIDATFDVITSLRATPCLWIASERHRSLMSYGFVGDFDAGFDYFDCLEGSITIEGFAE